MTSMTAPETQSSMGLAKLILPFEKFVVAGGPGFENEVGRTVWFVTTAMLEFEKIYLVHFRVSNAAPLLDSCLAYLALLPVNCHTLQCGDHTISRGNGDKREVFVSEITKSSMQSKSTPMYQVLTLGAPD